MKILLLFLVNWEKSIMPHAIVTGGSTGIGAATVDKFVTEGFSVSILDTNVSAGQQLVEKYNSKVMLFKADVGIRDEVRLAIKSAVLKFGTPDVLFANAGIYRFTSIFDLIEEDMRSLIEVNLCGVLYTVAEVAPLMREQKSGAIVLMSSDQAFIGKSGCLVYGATKGAVAQLAKGLSVELSEYGVRVNAVCPACVRTPMTEKIFQEVADTQKEDIEKVWANEAQAHPIGRVASPKDIASVVYFLSQDGASFMTGALIPIDGGLTSQTQSLSSLNVSDT